MSKEVVAEDSINIAKRLDGKHLTIEDFREFAEPLHNYLKGRLDMRSENHFNFDDLLVDFLTDKDAGFGITIEEG